MSDYDSGFVINEPTDGTFDAELKPITELEEENASLTAERDKLRGAAKNFLKDLEERVSRDGKHHPDEGVRDYLGNGKTLPIGNGVLFMLNEALKGESDNK